MQKRNLKELLISLLQNNHLLSVSDILVHLEKVNKIFNKTSVYRAIEQLLAEEVICQHFFSGNEAYYELREHHHDHLVCTRCGKVATAECTYTLPKDIGTFKADHHHTTVFGICGECQ